jgi:hypothetical protein
MVGLWKLFGSPLSREAGDMTELSWNHSPKPAEAPVAQQKAHPKLNGKH